MEKLDYIVWESAGELTDRLAGIAGDVSALTVHLADTAEAIPEPPLLLGRGPDAAAVVSVWLHSLDDRGPVEDALGDKVDGYLVTESVPQRRADRGWGDGERSPGVTHCTWFPKPDRLSDEDFYRGWHDIHTPASFRLHPLRWEYVRDAVARPVTAAAPPVRAIVFERFRTVEDYADPSRLYGPPETLDETMRDLPLYADFESISSAPFSEVILKSSDSQR
ncbi:MAG TPA: hypothetical protein VFB78_08530 [Acidimicrobiales bacterium]|nr:hypothetical protein [Acidimicrobiales bacterium]